MFFPPYHEPHLKSSPKAESWAAQQRLCYSLFHCDSARMSPTSPDQGLSVDVGYHLPWITYNSSLFWCKFQHMLLLGSLESIAYRPKFSSINHHRRPLWPLWAFLAKSLMQALVTAVPWMSIDAGTGGKSLNFSFHIIVLSQRLQFFRSNWSG